MMEENKNSEEFERSIDLLDRLSTIVEMNESNITECSLVEDHLEGGCRSFQDDSIISQGSDSFRTNSDCKRPSSLSIPETPPELLRKQINELRQEFEYVKNEHEELQEFTTLEKQVEHHNCVPKSEMHLLKGELDVVNEKMQCLIQENENFRKEIGLKELQIEELKSSQTAFPSTQNMLEKLLLRLSHYLKANCELEAYEIIVSNPALSLLMDSDENDEKDYNNQLHIFEEIMDSNYLSTLKSIEQVLKLLIINKRDLKNEVERLNFENKEIKTNLEKLGKQNEQLEISLGIAEFDINELNKKLSSAEFQVKELKDLLIISETKIVESNSLLTAAESANKCLENKHNKLHLIQEYVGFILSELKLILNRQDDIKLKSLSSELKGNKKLLSSVNQILDSNNQISLFEILGRLEDIFKFFENKNDSLLSQINDLYQNIMKLDSEKVELKAQIQSLECQLKNVSNYKNYSLALPNTQDENTILEEQFISLEKDALTTEHEYEQVLNLQKVSDYETNIQENELNRFQNILQNSCSSLISEFGNIIESLDFKEGLAAIFNNLENNLNTLNNLNFLLGSENKHAICDLYSKLKIKITSYEEHINLKLNEQNSFFKLLEGDLNKLSTEIKFLDNSVNNELISRLVKLESVFHLFGDKTIDFEGSIESTNKVEINDIQKELKYMLYTFEQCLSSDNPFVNFKAFIDSNMENHNFTSLNKLVDKDITSTFLNCYDKLKGVADLFEKWTLECQKTQKNVCNSKEKDHLTMLKELLIVEILSLGGNESKNDLLMYSSTDIFNKFMQSIINKEYELQEEYETGLNKIRNDFDVVRKKEEAQKSWILELEYELKQMTHEVENLKKSKCQVESTSKSLSKSLENSLNEISILNTNIVQLTSENNILKGNNEKCKQFLKTERETINYLRKICEDLKKEFQVETKTVLCLISKLSLLNKQIGCSCIKSKHSKTSEGLNKDHKSLYTGADQYKSICAKCSSKVDNELTEVEVLLQSLDKEKLLLKELLLSTNSEYLWDLSGKFHILQDVVEIFSKKIYERENVQSNTQLKFQNVLDSMTRDLSDLKLSIFKLYKEYVFEYRNKTNDIENSILNSGNELPLEMELECFKEDSVLNSNNMLSLQKELICVEGDCLQLTKKIDDFQNNIKAGQSFINRLKDELKDIVYKTSKKDLLIEGLYNEVAIEQNKKKEMENKYATINKQLDNYLQKNAKLEEEKNSLILQLTDINLVFSSTKFSFPVHIKDLKEKISYLMNACEENICMKSLLAEANENLRFVNDQCNLMVLYIKHIEGTMHSMSEKHSQFEEKIKCLTVQLLDINSVLNTVNCYIPVDLKERKDQIKYICNLFKESMDTKSSITVANESICFFSYQCTLMNDYIKKIETSINLLLSQREHLDYEFTCVKNQLTTTKDHLNEADKVFLHLLSVLPSNPSTPVEAVNLVKQITAKYNTLKASEVNLLMKQKAMEESISKQLEEIAKLNKLNANFKFDQRNSEDHIRNLRSELRSLRKKFVECNANPSGSKNVKATEFGTQTDVLCCSQRQEEILFLKETLRENNNKIQFLESRVQTKSSPYKRKSDLELTVFQAKERIKELNSMLMKQENANKELIELCKSKNIYLQEFESTSHET